MQHLDEGTIHSWLDGALSADEVARVEAHVKECAQCQAAVAEARGFIAASSRILTALDNAPRGVIPAAKPTKRIDPIVWRIAATVLVVAAGTLVVVRNSGLTERTPDKSSAAQASASQQANPEMRRETPQDAAATTSPTSGAGVARETPATTARPTVINRGPAGLSGAPRNQSLRAGVASPQQESRFSETAKDRRSVAADAKPTTRENDYSAAAPTPPAAAPSILRAPTRLEGAFGGRAAGVVAIGVMAEEPKLRVVGTPRALGQKLTLYEVAPGDTVVLAEEVRMELQEVVTSGAAAQPRAIAGAERARALTKAGAVVDTPRATAAQAPAPAPAAAPSFSEAEDGTATLIWKDSATGNVMKLSGRHTRPELEEIKRRIERARSAAADSAKKSR